MTNNLPEIKLGRNHKIKKMPTYKIQRPIKNNKSVVQNIQKIKLTKKRVREKEHSLKMQKSMKNF